MPISKQTPAQVFVDDFLGRLHQAIFEERFTFAEVRGDKKNSDTMYLLQYTYDDVINEVLSLSYSMFDHGPFSDEKVPPRGDCWQFKKIIQGYLIYIKIMKLYDDDYYVILSFHVDE